jgi:hypothetical protein
MMRPFTKHALAGALGLALLAPQPLRAQATGSQQQAAFTQSFGTCMAAKGYTVQ